MNKANIQKRYSLRQRWCLRNSYSFINWLSKYLLDAHHVLSTMLGINNTKMNESYLFSNSIWSCERWPTLPEQQWCIIIEEIGLLWHLRHYRLDKTPKNEKLVVKRRNWSDERKISGQNSVGTWWSRNRNGRRYWGRVLRLLLPSTKATLFLTVLYFWISSKILFEWSFTKIEIKSLY